MADLTVEQIEAALEWMKDGAPTDTWRTEIKTIVAAAERYLSILRGEGPTVYVEWKEDWVDQPFVMFTHDHEPIGEVPYKVGTYVLVKKEDK